MFWKEKSAKDSSPPPPPILGSAPSPPPELSKNAAAELNRELSAPDVDPLTAGIGMIKLGAKELLPGWLALFGRSDVFLVSLTQDAATAFVFGPANDRNYTAVFTRLEIAQQCLRENPQLKFAMRINGLDLLEIAQSGGRGIWINPLNDACSVRFPADAIGRLVQDLRSQRREPAPPILSTAQPAPTSPPIKLGAGMTGEFAGPVNALESDVTAFRNRTMPAPQFLESLFNHEIYVLPDAKSFARSGDQLRLTPGPTLFTITQPEYTALAIYTSPERAKPTTERYPEFHLAAKVHAGDFLIGTAPGIGLVLNPYWDINLEWSAAQFDKIKVMMRR